MEPSGSAYVREQPGLPVPEANDNLVYGTKETNVAHAHNSI